MDIPSVRFLAPCLVLGAFYLLLAVHPHMEDSDEVESKSGRLSEVQARALVAKANQYLEAKENEKALPLFQQLHNAFPQNASFIEQLAKLYSKMNRPKEEAEMWEQFLQSSQLPAEGCPYIGLAYRKLNDEVRAFDSFRRCLEIEENSDTLFFMGHALERRGETARAEVLYEKAMQRAPDYPDVVIGVARIWIKRGKIYKAKELILKQMQRFADNPDALLVAGLACARSQDYPAARKYFARGLQLRPNDPDLKSELAHLGGS